MHQFVVLYKHINIASIYAPGIVIYSDVPRRHPRHLSASDNEVWIYYFVRARRARI